MAYSTRPKLIVIVPAGKNKVVSKNDSDITSFGYRCEVFMDTANGRIRRKICVVSEFQPIRVIAADVLQV